MDWLGLHFLGEHSKNGQLLLSSHNPYLIFLAYLVAFTACLATLHMLERSIDTERPATQSVWRWVGASGLAGGLWAMHFICLLAFQSASDIHYQLSTTVVSLLIALVAIVLAMQVLSRPAPNPMQRLLAAVLLGLGICTMQYLSMAAMGLNALQYFDGMLFASSLLLALSASFCIVLLAEGWRSANNVFHQLFKYLLSAGTAMILLCAYFIGLWSLQIDLPTDSAASLPIVNSQWQLALMVAVVTLLLLGGAISASLVDKKLQHKEQDLKRVNALLSQLDQARMSLQQVAHFDPLTGLINRRGFNQIFAEKLVERAASNSLLAVMFLDIDHFKRINDSLGHDAGDQLLKVIAAQIRRSTRSHEDVVARFGGDEFYILINLTQRDEAQHLAQRIMQNLKEPIELAGRQMVMTTSIGISIFPDDGTTSDELLKHADLALYQSKENGRNSLNFFNSELKVQATQELRLEEELRNALRADSELTLYYQPIYDLKNRRVTKLEALVRWNHPEYGVLSPERFIGIAENNGLIAELDNWVLRKACHDLASLSRLGWTHLSVAVNCSALNLMREELADEIENALKASGIAPRQLELEVTENALMGNISNTSQLLRQIRTLGISLSIDHFGTGYSSLAYLKRLPLNTLKIDRCFIQDIPKSTQDMEIIQAIIAMAHTLHLQVVTEGVENLEQYEFLSQNGCDYIQGYLLSQPLALNDLTEVLKNLDLHPLPPTELAPSLI